MFPHLSSSKTLQSLWYIRCLPLFGHYRPVLIVHFSYGLPSSLAGFFQLSAGKNAALVSVCHYLEYHSRVGDRFSSSGRIRCVQFPVILFLKLGAGHSHGCILWQFNFTVQYKNQLIISLNCGILSLRFRVFHRSLILTQKTTSAKSFENSFSEVLIIYTSPGSISRYRRLLSSPPLEILLSSSNCQFWPGIFAPHFLIKSSVLKVVYPS